LSLLRADPELTALVLNPFPAFNFYKRFTLYHDRLC
jgi:hypothetical protein